MKQKRIFFKIYFYSVSCYTGVFDKYDDSTRWDDEIEPKDTSGTKNQNWKNLEFRLFTLVRQYNETVCIGCVLGFLVLVTEKVVFLGFLLSTFYLFIFGWKLDF